MFRPFLSRLILFSFFSLSLYAGQTTWFSDEPRQMPPLLADPLEAQMRSGYLLRGDKRSFLDMGLGGQLDFVRTEQDWGTLVFQWRAHMHARFEFFSKSFDLQDTDYIGGMSASLKQNSMVYEVLVTHQSSHLGDDIIERKLRNPINYSFESARLLASYADAYLRLYGGIHFLYRSDPKNLKWKPSPIVGAEWRPFTEAPLFFTAMDLRFLGAHRYSPNLNTAIGYDLGNPTETARRQRIQLEVFNGHSLLGQYYENREFYLMFGFLYAF